MGESVLNITQYPKILKKQIEKKYSIVYVKIRSTFALTYLNNLKTLNQLSHFQLESLIHFLFHIAAGMTLQAPGTKQTLHIPDFQETQATVSIK